MPTPPPCTALAPLQQETHFKIQRFRLREGDPRGQGGADGAWRLSSLLPPPCLPGESPQVTYRRGGSRPQCHLCTPTWPLGTWVSALEAAAPLGTHGSPRPGGARGPWWTLTLCRSPVARSTGPGALGNDCSRGRREGSPGPARPAPARSWSPGLRSHLPPKPLTSVVTA